MRIGYSSCERERVRVREREHVTDRGSGLFYRRSHDAGGLRQLSHAGGLGCAAPSSRQLRSDLVEYGLGRPSPPELMD